MRFGVVALLLTGGSAAVFRISLRGVGLLLGFRPTGAAWAMLQRTALTPQKGEAPLVSHESINAKGSLDGCR